MVRAGMLFGVMAFAFAACGGGDDGPKAMEGNVNATQAKTSVMSCSMLKAAVDSMMGPGVASSVLAVNSSAQGIVTPKTSATMGALVNEALETMSQAQTTAGSQSCTASKCTFTSYGSGGVTLDGAVDVAAGTGDGKNIKWDITMKTTQSGGFTYKGTGNIDVSSTSLTGEVNSEATIAGYATPQGTVSGGSTTTLKYMAVVLSSGAATGGSLWAKTVTTGSSGGQSATQAYEGTVSFSK